MTSHPLLRRFHPPLGWWDAAVLTGSAIALAASAASRPSATAPVAGAVLVFLVAWAAAGRRGTADLSVPVWFLGVLVAVCFAGAFATPAFATFQVVAYPVAWIACGDFRRAFVANAAVAVAICAGYARLAGPVEALAVVGVSFGFSIAMGAWITRIEHVSRDRQALVDRLTATQDQVAALNREAGTVAERERMARELHDTLAQSLAGIVMLAERARSKHPGDASLGVLEDAARQALSEARGLVTAGANVPLEGGLQAALGVLAERFRRETGLAVAVEATAEVPRGLEVVLLRCAQEGLANVRKHALATAVRLRIAEADGVATLTVADDGRGPGDGEGFGIVGMRDRLALVGGTVDLRAGTDGGSELVVRAPLRESVAS